MKAMVTASATVAAKAISSMMGRSGGKSNSDMRWQQRQQLRLINGNDSNNRGNGQHHHQHQRWQRGAVAMGGGKSDSGYLDGMVRR